MQFRSKLATVYSYHTWVHMLDKEHMPMLQSPKNWVYLDSVGLLFGETTLSLH